ncbi:hypothetical protein [Acidithiobacillus sulfuriphilus]|uniref:Uncharacterized protein n=2 Tax=Acidithiobacillus sulfuriphilus TaxID=1867749 RepID=A0ACD5HR84_9PROT|nr:hypothetical protein [Acidithiobacillus sulfuriphilus]MCL5979521.1 hypothetical protein [Gammaproteobacteria bacterium]
MMHAYRSRWQLGSWWARLLATLVSMILVIGLLFFSIFVFLALAVMAVAAGILLWWQRRKLQKRGGSGVIVAEYREIRHRQPPPGDGR